MFNSISNNEIKRAIQDKSINIVIIKPSRTISSTERNVISYIIPEGVEEIDLSIVRSFMGRKSLTFEFEPHYPYELYEADDNQIILGFKDNRILRISYKIRKCY